MFFVVCSLLYAYVVACLLFALRCVLRIVVVFGLIVWCVVFVICLLIVLGCVWTSI